jgi:hypothetical protein
MLGVLLSAGAICQSLPIAGRPEDVGISSQRLERVRRQMQGSAPRLPSLAAADELHDLQTSAAGDRRGSPIVRLDDAAVQFHRHAGGIQSQRFQQLPDRLAVRNRPNLPVDRDFDLLVG